MGRIGIQKRLTLQEKRRITAAYDSGACVKDIMLRFNRSRKVVMLILTNKTNPVTQS